MMNFVPTSTTPITAQIRLQKDVPRRAPFFKLAIGVAGGGLRPQEVFRSMQADDSNS
jgi:hypothetical protein